MVYASERLFAQPGATRVFFLRRLARIVPLYWAATAILVGYVYVAHRIFPPPFITTEGVIASFLFIPYPLPSGLMAPVHALGWTLNYEMFFYAVFALAIMLPRRSAVFVITTLFMLLVALGLLVPLPPAVRVLVQPDHPRILLRHADRARLARRQAAAALGLAAADRRGARRLRGLGGVGAVRRMALRSNGACPAPCWSPRLRSRGRRRRRVRSRASSSFSATRPIRSISCTRSSSRRVRRLMPSLDTPLMPWLYALALIGASIAAACLSYLWFERPITRALQRWIGRSAKDA